MTVKTKVSILSTLLIFMVGFFAIPVSASSSFASPLQFFNSVPAKNYDVSKHGNSPSVLYLGNVLALQIEKQPAGNYNYVTSLQNFLTEFQAASNYGTIGLLAHNYLAGQYFFQISQGQEIELVYNDNRSEKFVVTKIAKYQALSPNSPSSDFIDLVTGDQSTASQLFKKMYRNQSGNLVLQTCIYQDGNPAWGRLFIIAEPVAKNR